MSSYVDEKGKMDEKLNPKKKQETDWTQMLGLMALGQGASAKTMLGFALGKLLRELWDRHLWERRQKQMTPTGEQVGAALGTGGKDAGGTKAAGNGYVPTRGLLGYKGAMERVSENRLRDAVAKSGNPAFQDFMNSAVMGGYTPTESAGDAWDALAARQVQGAIAGMPLGKVRDSLLAASPASVWSFGVNPNLSVPPAAATNTADTAANTDATANTAATDAAAVNAAANAAANAPGASQLAAMAAALSPNSPVKLTMDTDALASWLSGGNSTPVFGLKDEDKNPFVFRY